APQANLKRLAGRGASPELNSWRTVAADPLARQLRLLRRSTIQPRAVNRGNVPRRGLRDTKCSRGNHHSSKCRSDFDGLGPRGRVWSRRPYKVRLAAGPG